MVITRTGVKTQLVFVGVLSSCLGLGCSMYENTRRRMERRTLRRARLRVSSRTATRWHGERTAPAPVESTTTSAGGRGMSRRRGRGTRQSSECLSQWSGCFQKLAPTKRTKSHCQIKAGIDGDRESRNACHTSAGSVSHASLFRRNSTSLATTASLCHRERTGPGVCS